MGMTDGHVLVTDSTCILTSVMNTHSELEKHGKGSHDDQASICFHCCSQDTHELSYRHHVCAQLSGH